LAKLKETKKHWTILKIQALYFGLVRSA